MPQVISNEEIKQMIENAIPAAEVEIVSDDGVHFAARVIAKQFAGKLPIARHRLIYAALGDGMESRIHALSIQAFTPEEWAAKA
jgi:acid stress-induced BolA-like protein IbaG/YrbA